MLICFPCQIPWLFYGKEQDQIKINIINLWVYITKTKIYIKSFSLNETIPLVMSAQKKSSKELILFSKSFIKTTSSASEITFTFVLT